MGNCMPREAAGEKRDEIIEETAEVKREGENDGKKKLRIKIVVTKDELDWLVFQLKFREGKSLEDVLGELERGRGKASSWKPSLQSISESPEIIYG
nr:uncharacterized protein LOC105124430 [Ipomoea trifida]